ncbi:MAG: sugar phosphate nucleotidyltransferase [Candidatus Solibacter sp.]
MRIRKAVITAAGQSQRALPLQTLIDRDGQEKSVICILIEQAMSANVEEIGVVVYPGDEGRYADAAGRHASDVRFIPQPQPKGYGNAILCAHEFTGSDPFLHMVGDHLYVSAGSDASAHRLVALAESAECSVSGVQATRESLLPHFGTVAGRRVEGRSDLYRVETVIEKPTPTEAEQRLMVPGIRAGYYLCFFGIHVLTPTVMEMLAKGAPTLSAALAELARHEQYLALEEDGRRYDLGARYGLLVAQIALALNGQDRAQVLSQMLELLADREARNGAAAGAGQ